jgi:MFS family permease
MGIGDAAAAPVSRARIERYLPRSLRVLRHRDFALVQLGNGISSAGTWMQYVGLGWGIRQLTAWPFAVALSLVAQFGPSLVLSPFAGSVADRFDRRKVVIVGSFLMVFPPIAIGVLITMHSQTITWILSLAALGGVAQAMTMPAMTAMVAHIVPEDEIAQAIAGTSVIQNLTRIAGPSLGAVAISAWGLDWAFYLNGLSRLAVVVAWMLVRPVVTRWPSERESFATQTREGIRYARANPQVMQLLLLGVVMSLLVYQSALLPIIARDVLHSGASGFGLLQSASGVGAIIGAVVAGEIITNRRRRLALAGGVLATGLAYADVALSHSLSVSVAGMGLFGLAFFMANTVTQSVLMTATPDAYRGRVMGLFSMVMVGGIPIAALVGGGLGSWFGATKTVGVAAVLVLAYGVWFVASGAVRKIGVAEPVTERADALPPATPQFTPVTPADGRTDHGGAPPHVRLLGAAEALGQVDAASAQEASSRSRVRGATDAPSV